MNTTNQDHDETSVAANRPADTNRTQASGYPVPPSLPAERSEDGTAPKADLTWDISDWFKIS